MICAPRAFTAIARPHVRWCVGVSVSVCVCMCVDLATCDWEKILQCFTLISVVQIYTSMLHNHFSCLDLYHLINGSTSHHTQQATGGGWDFIVGCPLGHYCPYGSGAPIPCPANFYSKKSNVAKESDCLPCSFPMTSGEVCVTDVLCVCVCDIVTQEGRV